MAVTFPSQQSMGYKSKWVELLGEAVKKIGEGRGGELNDQEREVLRILTEIPDIQKMGIWDNLNDTQKQLVKEATVSMANKKLDAAGEKIEKAIDKIENKTLQRWAKKKWKNIKEKTAPLRTLLFDNYKYASDLVNYLKQSSTPFLNQLKGASPAIMELFNAFMNGLGDFCAEKKRASSTDGWLKYMSDLLREGWGQFGGTSSGKPVERSSVDKGGGLGMALYEGFTKVPALGK